jgi:LysR family glycine cleavage system transcriptional activator
MTRRVPPLESIEAFVTASRCRSFREAAKKLALSASAFSRRVQKLESFVGMPLFKRSSAAVELTTGGQTYLAEIDSAMEVIGQATARMRSIRRVGRLRLMVSQSFATGWLVRRLPDFYAQGGSEIDLHIGRDLQYAHTGDVDLAVLGGDLDLRRLSADRLIDVQAAVVAAPQMVEGLTPPTCIEDLRNHRLLAMDAPANGWQRWLAQAGHPNLTLATPTRFESLLLMYEAAASGLGVALAIPIVADALMREGRLRACFPLCLPLGTGYSMVYGDDAVRRRTDVQKFRDWLRKQFRQSELEFAQHVYANSSRPRAGSSVLSYEARECATRTVLVRQTVHTS